MATPPGVQQELPQAPNRRRVGIHRSRQLTRALQKANNSNSSNSSSNNNNNNNNSNNTTTSATTTWGTSKLMYRLGATARRGRTAAAAAAAAEAGMETSGSAPNGSIHGTATSSTDPSGSSIFSTTNTERKRTASGHPVSRAQQQDEGGPPQRRSARLNMFKTSAGRTNGGASSSLGTANTRELKKARPPVSRIVRPGSSGSTVGRVVSGNRKPVVDDGMDVDPMEGPRVRDSTTSTASTASTAQLTAQQSNASLAAAAAAAKHAAEYDPTKTEEALRWIFELLKKLGGGYLGVSQFQCSDALQLLGSLSRTQSETPWVQALMGRAQYELAAYAEAEVHFRRLRALAPTRLEDMEVYSTILWFLKRETDLSFLAHELVDAAWTSPQAWCALGNAWSLAQDHEQALRCFRRATQLDRKFAYAYTLQGHEHVVNEEYDKAKAAYRHAVTADRRHYNAYYGLGRVYEKLGDFDKAFANYHTAATIHPTNAVLVCCIGKVLERQKQILPALQYFTKATELAPRAAQTRFRKARALLAIGQLSAAQQELMILKDLAPDEAAVHFLLGKLYKTLNDKSSAVRHFTIALSLDPKASQKIKQAIGSLEDDDDGLEDYMVT